MERRWLALGRTPSEVMAIVDGTCNTIECPSAGEGLLRPDAVVPKEVVKNEEEETVVSPALSWAT